jgi:uncharacterized protein (DUF2336 family)
MSTDWVTDLPTDDGHTATPSAGQDEAERVRQAASQGASLSALQSLANDPAVTVRAAVAMNVATNQAAGSSLFHLLARDPDDRVRALLGRRLSLLLPGLSVEDHAQLRDNAIATLMLLVNDEAERVRGAIADAVKDMPDMPRELIQRLARDISISVAEPVIRLSPVLTDQDLLALISSPPGPATVIAVARRPGLAAQVATAIAEGENVEAIGALLANRTAAIGERTLDGLIERAARHVEWHQALVRRPRLSPQAAAALAGIVTGQVLHELAERADLPTALARTLAQRLDLRPSPGAGPGAGPVGGPVVDSRLAGQDSADAAVNIDPPSLEQAVTQARAMGKSGQLSEDSLIAAARRGEARLCTAMLAATAGVAADVVDRAARLRSAKGLVSLIWRAGFTMRAAGPIQTLLARLPPELVLHPDEHGEFPLSAEEMRWQVEFLMRIGREAPVFP